MKSSLNTQYPGLLFLSFFLSACGGGSSGGGSTSTPSGNPTNNGNTTGLASIVSFDVKGTRADVAGRAPLNPAENNGKWSITWEAKLKEAQVNQLQVNIYVSEDDKLSSTDPVIYSALCTGTQCIGNTKITMSCSFNSDSIPDCKKDLLGGVFQYYNFKPFLDKIPKNAYFILTAKATADIYDKYKAISTHPVVFE